MISGIVLAAGASTRMKTPKMLLPLGKGTVLSSVVSPLLEAGLDRVLVVLGCGAEEVERRAGLSADPRLELSVNANWREGMSSSLRWGLAACGDSDAVLVALGDQPGISPALVQRVLRAWKPDRALVVPVCGSRAVHPVLFGRALFAELAALSGDVGARAIVQRHWEEAVFVEGVGLPDLDTEEDYRRFLEGSPGGGDEGFEAPALPRNPTRGR
jgi:molybdenum cofactor cytidylyltransferase